MQEHLANTIKNEIKAVQAILLYEIGERESNKQYFLTQNPIQNGAILEGRPITEETVRRVAKLITPEEKLGLIEENVLLDCKSKRIMAWWVGAKQRMIHFSQDTGIKSGKAPMPAMLFVTNNGSLRVFALKENKRPALDTMLYSPPFYNSSAYGGVCMGDIKTPESRDTKKWETAFFESRFTLHGEPKLEGISGKTLWQRLVGSGKKVFPIEYLAEFATLNTLINNLGGYNEYA